LFKSRNLRSQQTAKIAGADFNPEFPTVGVDAKGNVGIVADSITPTTDLSVLLWTHAKNDPPNTFKGPIMLSPVRIPIRA